MDHYKVNCEYDLLINVNKIKDNGKPIKKKHIIDLAGKILKDGLAVPCFVVKNEDCYILVDGINRFRALVNYFKAETIPCVVREKKESGEHAP